MTHARRRPPLLSRVKRWFREQARLQVILPVALAVGLLGYVMSVAVAPHSAPELWDIIQQTLVIILIATFPYLAARAWVWHRLLQQLGFRIPWRQIMASFAAGEMTKSIPAGVYTQNYILGKLNHFSAVSNVRSSMATTAMLGLETLVAVPVVLIPGIPGQDWVRWAITAVIGFWVVLVVLAWVLTNHLEHSLNPLRHPRLNTIATLAAEFLEAGKELITARTLVNLGPTLLYMLVYVVDLSLILHALGHSISFLHVMVVYAASVLAVVLIPIPTEIGITEITGLSALRAYGVPASAAALAMLALRLLATGLTIIVAGALLFIMRDELRQAAEGQHGAAGTPATQEA